MDARIVGGAAISGAVNAPGRYYFWDYQGFGLSQLLSKANGLKADASDDYVITRTDKRGRRTILRVTAESRIRERKDENVKLQDGDEVHVPARGDREIDDHPFLANSPAIQPEKPNSKILPENHSKISNAGLSGLDPKWIEWGQYLQRVIDIVQFQWERRLLEMSALPARDKSVAVKFVMNDVGKIDRVVSVDGTASAIAAQVCVEAITQNPPYGEWTQEMRASLGAEQQMTFTFYYQ